MAHSVSFDPKDMLNRAIVAHYVGIKAAVRRSGHSKSSAVDVVHDLYVKLAEKPEALKGKRSLGAFLRRAAINLGIDKLRRTQFEERLFSGTEEEASIVVAEVEAPDYRLEVEARLAALRSAIRELPHRRQAVFILHRLHQMEPDEIAGKMKISRNMVDQHLRRALTHCLDRLLQMD